MALTSCASLNGPDALQFDPQKTLATNTPFEHRVIQTGYWNSLQQKAQAKWSFCHKAVSASLFVMIGDLPAQSSQQGICRLASVQSILDKGFSVIVVPYPSVIGEEARKDHPKDLWLAIQQILQSGQSHARAKTVEKWEGLWLSDKASVWASRIIPILKERGLQNLVIENGMFDLPSLANQSESSTVQTYLKQLRDSAALDLDDASLAFDFESLPKNVYIYHDNASKSPDLGQAKEFAASLKSSGFNANFLQLDLPKEGINEALRFQILQKILSSSP
jgi:hypothetical protein